MRRRRAARDGRPGRTRSNVTAAPRPRLRECCLGNLARSVRPTRASCKSHCKEQVGNNEIEPAVVSYSQRLVLRSDQTRLTPRLASFGQNAGWVRFAKMRGAPRPHAEERRSAMQAQVLSAADARCDASRSMRGLPPPHPSRRAHARPDLRQRLRTRAPQDEAAQGIPNSRFVAEPFSVIPNSRCQTAHLVPAAHFCARGLQLRFTNPESRGGRSAERRAGARRNTREARRIAARQALARRLASHDAGRSPLGAPPWRFWASGPRFRLLGRPPPYNGGQLPSDPCSELLAARS